MKEIYWPSKETKKKSWVSENSVYATAGKNPLKFWEAQAKNLMWFEKWKKVYARKGLRFEWFAKGKINMSYNCLEKNIYDGKGEKTALIWIPEPNEKIIRLSYKELLERTNKFANALKKLGVRKGDVVGIYLPMIPEAMISMLACARIGAAHIVIFSAFSAEGLNERLKATKAKVLITANGYYRNGKVIELIPKVEEGVKKTDVKNIICVERIKNGKKIGLSYGKLVENEKPECEAEKMDSEDLFFVLPESGTSGEFIPIAHTCGGYAVQAFASGRFIFDFNRNDVYWCTGDIGWITGHTYGVYSPLLNGVTSIFYEGALDFPTKERWAEIIEENGVSILYTSPTAVRMFEQETQKTKSFKFEKLRIIGTVGETIDEQTWNWFYENVGKKKTVVLDTYWQTETGAIIVSSLPGIGPFKPGFAGRAFPGIKLEILNDKRKKVKANEKGNLVVLPPFCPAMLREVYGNKKKYDEYFLRFGKNFYDTSDLALRTKDGMIKIAGRADDVIKVAGHRMSTAEIEDAIESLKGVIEAAIVGKSDKLKGMVPIAFVRAEKITKEQIVAKVVEKIGPIAKPAEIYFVDELPRTKSGKSVRGALRELLEGNEVKEISALINPESLKKIKEIISRH